MSSARNLGITAAEGRWIAFLDDDDLWAPDKLALQIRAAAAGGTGMGLRRLREHHRKASCHRGGAPGTARGRGGGTGQAEPRPGRLLGVIVLAEAP